MKRNISHQIDWIPTLFFLAVAGIVFYLSATSLTTQGAASGTAITNAAMYPRLVARVLVVLVVLHVLVTFGTLWKQKEATVRDVRATDEHRGKIEKKNGVLATAGRQIAVSSLVFVAYLYLLPLLGYLVATHLFVLAVVLTLGMRDVTRAVLFAVVLTFACSLVFEGVFNVRLPRGVFGIALSF